MLDHYDLYINEYKFKGRIKKGVNEFSKQILQDADLVVVTTAHTEVN